MRTKFLAFLVLSLALVLSACGGGPTTINQAAAPQIRTLNVNGNGQVSLTRHCAPSKPNQICSSASG